MDIEEALRRLLMLGLPLVPLACGDRDVTSQGGFMCQAPVSPFDVMGSILRSDPSDGDPAAWDLCAEGGDCTTTCAAVARANLAVGFVSVATCKRIEVGAVRGGDAGGAGGSTTGSADDGGPASDVDAASSDAASDAVAVDAITLHVTGTAGPGCTGRRPEGMVEVGAPARGTPSGRWLARAAALEAASVPAFRRLARELGVHGAPEQLVRAARAGVAEESRHAILMARAARTRGATPRAFRVAPMGVRPLLAVAVENAREGCVRETLGALNAVHQAARAADPALREAFKEIARDESRHARLAWEVDAWARSVLPTRVAHLVDDARCEEGARLVAELACASTAPALARELGLPPAAIARSLARRARQALWAA
jgi:hypothetical protein